MSFIRLDPESAEVLVSDEPPNADYVFEALRPRVTYDDETAEASRAQTPTETLFGPLVTWVLMDDHSRDYGPYGGFGLWEFQPWLEVLVRQVVRLIQLHGGDLVEYLHHNVPDWTAHSVYDVVLMGAGRTIYRRVRKSHKAMSDEGLAPQSPQDPRFDYAGLAGDEKLAELIARVALLMGQHTDPGTWDAVVRGEDIHMKAIAEELTAIGNVVFVPEEEPDEGPSSGEAPAVSEEDFDVQDDEATRSPRFITLDPATAEVAINDERPNEGLFLSAPRARVVPSPIDGEPSRAPTPTETLFDGLVDWLLLDAPEHRGLGQYGGGFAPNFQPWTEIVLRQIVRLLQLYGDELVSYLAHHSPDWVGGAVVGLVLAKASEAWGRLKVGLSRMAAVGVAPQSPEDERFDHAALVEDRLLAELVARIAVLLSQLSPDHWQAVIRGEHIGMVTGTDVENAGPDASIVLRAEEEETRIHEERLRLNLEAVKDELADEALDSDA